MNQEAESDYCKDEREQRHPVHYPTVQIPQCHRAEIEKIRIIQNLIDAAEDEGDHTGLKEYGSNLQLVVVVHAMPSLNDIAYDMETSL